MDKNKAEKVMDGVVRQLVAKDCNWRDYYNFKYMMTHRELRGMWVFLSLLALVFTIVGGIQYMSESFWIGLLIATLGSVIVLRVMRLIFELLMCPFSIIELLREIRDELKNKKAE